MINIKKLKYLLEKQPDYLFQDTRKDKELLNYLYDVPKNGYRLIYGISGNHLNYNNTDSFLGFILDEDFDEQGNKLHTQLCAVLYFPSLDLEDKDCFHYFYDFKKEEHESFLDFQNKFLTWADKYDLDFDLKVFLLSDFFAFNIKLYSDCEESNNV